MVRIDLVVIRTVPNPDVVIVLRRSSDEKLVYVVEMISNPPRITVVAGPGSEISQAVHLHLVITNLVGRRTIEEKDPCISIGEKVFFNYVVRGRGSV